jgi:hypothetical protein
LGTPVPGQAGEVVVDGGEPGEGLGGVGAVVGVRDHGEVGAGDGVGHGGRGVAQAGVVLPDDDGGRRADLGEAVDERRVGVEFAAEGAQCLGVHTGDAVRGALGRARRVVREGGGIGWLG